MLAPAAGLVSLMAALVFVVRQTEKAAHMSNGESLKSIRLDQVLWATINPRHTDSFVIDLGHDRKVKLQAASERERDAWVAAIEVAKTKAATAQAENTANNAMSTGSRSTPGVSSAVASASRPFGTPISARDSGGDAGAGVSPAQIDAELLRSGGKPVQGCCVIS